MRSLAVISMLVFATPSIAQADIKINLRASVAVHCGIADFAHDGDQLHIRTFCNSENFRLILTSADGSPIVVEAGSPQAQVSAMQNELQVALNQPGFQQLAIRLEAGVDPASVSAVLVAG